MPGNGVVGASYGDLLVTSLVVLGGVCIVAFVVVRIAGRFLATGRSRGAHLLDVVARLPLEPRRSIYVVEVAGKTLLVGTSEMGLSLLAELDGGEVRARVVERPNFGELVRSAWQRRRGTSADEAPARRRVDQVPPHRDPERRVQQRSGEAALAHVRRAGDDGEVAGAYEVGGARGSYEAGRAREVGEVQPVGGVRGASEAQAVGEVQAVCEAQELGEVHEVGGAHEAHGVR